MPARAWSRACALAMSLFVCLGPVTGAAQDAGARRRAALEARLTADPADTAALCELGWATFRSGETERARGLLDRGVDLLVRTVPPETAQAERRTRASRLGACLYSRGRLRAAAGDRSGASDDYVRSLAYRDNAATEQALREAAATAPIALAIHQDSVVPDPIRHALAQCPERTRSWPARSQAFPGVVMLPSTGRAGRAFLVPGPCRVVGSASVLAVETPAGARTIDVPAASELEPDVKRISLLSDGTSASPAWLIVQGTDTGQATSCGIEHEEELLVSVVWDGPDGLGILEIGTERALSRCDDSSESTTFEPFFHDAATIHVLRISRTDDHVDGIQERLLPLPAIATPTTPTPLVPTPPAPTPTAPTATTTGPSYVSDTVVTIAEPATTVRHALGSSGALALLVVAEGAVDLGGGLRRGAHRAILASYDAAGRHGFDRPMLEGCASLGRTDHCTVDALAVDDQGNVLIAGGFQAPLDLGRGVRTSRGGADGFLAAYAPDGAVRFEVTLGGTGDDRVTALTTDRAGNTYIAGTIATAIDLGPGRTLLGPGAFVASYGPDGSLRAAFPLPSSTWPAALAIDAAGNAVVAGTYSGRVHYGSGARRGPPDYSERRAFVASYDPRGRRRFDRDFAAREASSVATDRDGNVFVAGTTSGDVELGGGVRGGYLGIYLVSYDPRGRHRFDRVFTGGGLGVSPHGLAVDDAGNVVLAGSFIGRLDFGDGERASRSRGDVFVTSYSPDGHHRFARTFVRGNDAFPPALTLGGSGTLLIAARLSGAIVDLGGGARTGDVFVVRLRDTDLDR